jgi:hypothetical protein
LDSLSIHIYPHHTTTTTSTSITRHSRPRTNISTGDTIARTCPSTTTRQLRLGSKAVSQPTHGHLLLNGTIITRLGIAITTLEVATDRVGDTARLTHSSAAIRRWVAAGDGGTRCVVQISDGGGQAWQARTEAGVVIDMEIY